MKKLETQLVWWGYIHVNRSIQVKRYWDMEDIRAAEQSPFVIAVFEPFYARDRDHAERTIRRVKMKHFKKLGKHYGYPTCCIDWFISRFFGFSIHQLTDAQDAVNGGNGFIPCPTCADRVHSGEISIEDLITNREHPLPYPQVDRKYMEENYGC